MSGFQVFVKTITGKKLQIDTYPNDTILALKDKIQWQIGHPADRMNLIFNGKILENGTILSDHKIISGSTVHCQQLF